VRRLTRAAGSATIGRTGSISSRENPSDKGSVMP
jgi:hypothetical protein